MNCPYCGSELPDGTKTCPGCGADLTHEDLPDGTPETVRCPGCGKTVDASLLFCPNCGAALHSDEGPKMRPDTRTESMFEGANQDTQWREPLPPGVSPAWRVRSKTAATLLAFFLGGFGAHEFYLGHPKKAILYILFAFSGFPMIIGILKGAQYVLESDEDFMRDNQVLLERYRQS